VIPISGGGARDGSDTALAHFGRGGGVRLVVCGFLRGCCGGDGSEGCCCGCGGGCGGDAGGRDNGDGCAGGSGGEATDIACFSGGDEEEGSDTCVCSDDREARKGGEAGGDSMMISAAEGVRDCVVVVLVSVVAVIAVAIVVVAVVAVAVVVAVAATDVVDIMGSPTASIDTIIAAPVPATTLAFTPTTLESRGAS
jgi:hypothetical protein